MPPRVAWWYMMSLLLGLAVFCLARIALGAPPSDVDPDSPTAQWYRAQKQPGTGYICCSLADGRPVVTRFRHGHLEAFVDRKSFGPSAPDDWIEVPESVMIRGVENPNGEPVLFWYGGEVRCFIDASGT